MNIVWCFVLSEDSILFCCLNAVWVSRHLSAARLCVCGPGVSLLLGHDIIGCLHDLVHLVHLAL